MAFEGLGSPPLVVVDADLLYPFHLRNLLVQFGMDAVMAPRWTARIHAEWTGSSAAAGRVPRERLMLTLDLMNSALPEADLRGWEARMDGLMLPDPGNRLVLSAALVVKAGTILNMSLHNFPASTSAPHKPRAVVKTAS